MMRAPANNSQSLQPLPPNVQPDISGNVDNSVQVAPSAVQQSQPAQNAYSQQPAIQNGISAASFAPVPSFVLPYIAIAALILIAGGVVWLWKSF